MTSVLPKRLWSLAVVPIVLVIGIVLVFVVRGGSTGTGFPSVGDDFAAAGPFSVSVHQAGNHTYYYPDDAVDGDRRHPVILWGNATGSVPDDYDALLRHLGSHGFIVAAANDAFAGSGLELLAGLGELEVMDGDGGRFAGAVDIGRVGATGHSLGGDGAMETGSDPRVDTVFPVEPWRGDPSEVAVPSAFFAGQDDQVAPAATVVEKFEGLGDVPAVYAELAGADHLEPTGDGGAFRGALTAWARWHLMDDDRAERLFVGPDCSLCRSDDWSAYETNAAFEADPRPDVEG